MRDLHIYLHCELKIHYCLLVTGHQLSQRGKTPHWHHHGLSCLPWWCVQMGWESCGPTWFVCTADTHIWVSWEAGLHLIQSFVCPPTFLLLVPPPLTTLFSRTLSSSNIFLRCLYMDFFLPIVKTISQITGRV